MTAYVRIAPKGSAAAAALGSSGRMPLSNAGRCHVDASWSRPSAACSHREMRCARPLLALQPGRGRPCPHQPPGGQVLHTREGLAPVSLPLAGRLGTPGAWPTCWHGAPRSRYLTFSIAVNDYGLELLSAKPRGLNPRCCRIWWRRHAHRRGVRTGGRGAGQPERHRIALMAFREIARIAQAHLSKPPRRASAATASCRRLRPCTTTCSRSTTRTTCCWPRPGPNCWWELDMDRLAQTLQRGGDARPCHPRAGRPFALPLMVERFRERLSTESLGDRLERMVQALEVAADNTMGTHLAPTRDTTHWDLAPRCARAAPPAHAPNAHAGAARVLTLQPGPLRRPSTHSHCHRYARRSMAALTSPITTPSPPTRANPAGACP